MAGDTPQQNRPAQEEQEREPQVAVAPLNAIAQEDIGKGAAKLDAWLQSISDGWITLARLSTVAGTIPVVGNIMALADAIMDVVRMIQKKSWDQFLEWVSLVINVIGVIPFPPTMAAARMSLRPMLALIRQNAGRVIKDQAGRAFANAGEAVVTVAVGHLNDTIAGEIDKFVDEAMGLLDSMLKDCANMIDAVVDALLDIMQRGLGEKPLLTVTPPMERKTYDPHTQTTMGSLLSTLSSWGTSASNTAKSGINRVSKAASGLIPAWAVVKVKETMGALLNIKQVARGKLQAMASEAERNSIKSLLKMLKTALLKRKNRRNGIVNASEGARVDSKKPGGEVGLAAAQAGPGGDPGCKNCPARSSAGGAISLAMGCESFMHTDFVLAAPLPITWARTYRSNLGAFDQGSLGARWLTPYSTRVDIATPAQGPRQGQPSLVYHGADGRSHAYPLLAVGQHHRDSIEEVTLTRLSPSLLTLDFGKAMPAGTPSDWRETYELVDTAAAKVRAQGKQHFRLVAQHSSNGLAIGLRYDHVIAATGEQVLSDIISKQGDATLAHAGIRPHAHSGLIESLWEIKDGQPVRQLAAYTHDGEGDLVAAQDENGAGWQYSYSHHLLTRYTDRTGRGMNLEYDGTSADAKAVREWSDDGSFALKLEWDKNIRLTYVTDALGHETWYYYDILGYTYRIIHPDQLEEWFFRDSAKNITRHIHTDGTTDDYVYDANGNLKTHTRADGSSVHYAYDARHRITGILDAEGGAWKRDYDASGNLTEEIDPLGHKTEYAYDNAGRPVRITDAKGGIKTLAYTPDGQLASHTDCSGKTTQWAYDGRGRLARITDALGQATRFRYTETGESAQSAMPGQANHPGQLEEIVHPDNASEYFAHDAEGRLLAHTDALGRRTSYGYTRAGLVAQRTDAAGRTLKYHWDLLGRLTELHNENGSRYDFRYDPVGKLLEETGFDRKATEYRYEPSTGVLAEVVEAGHATQLQFDALGRLSERKSGDDAESFAYDRNGRLVEATNAEARLQWFYDRAGNLVREHQHYLDHGHTAVWQHGYDELNRRIASIRPDGHVTQWLTYGSGHVHGLLVDGQDILGFERDDLHREIGREQGNGLTQKLHYDPAGRLLEQQISQTRPGAIEAVGIRRSYAYDKAGQLMAIGDSRRGNLSYRYDPVGRLLEAHGRLGRETFAFDPAGNIGHPSDDTGANAQAAGPVTTRVAVRLNGDGRSMAGRLMDNLLKDYAGTHYTWDERGNLIERTWNGEKTVFTWDGFNRMRSASTYGKTTHFSYDALGRRIAKRSEHDVTLFGWDGDTLAFESTQSTEGQQEQQAWRGDSVHYIHEPGSFVPLMQIRQAQAVALSQTTDVKALIAANGGRYDIEQDPLWSGQQLKTPQAFTREEIAFYQCDHLGTPQELTDHKGRIAWSAQYKAWGEAKQAISEAGRKAGFRNPIRFQGQYFDGETGLHYNRYRYYDSVSGRFVSKDPIGLFGGIHLQQYAPNPVEWIDPLGLNRTSGAGRKPESSKPNQNPKCSECRKPWEVNRYDRLCDGHVSGVGRVKYFYDPKTRQWWSPDQTGHGGSAWKVYNSDGSWRADADRYGDFMSKHKSETGKNVDFKNMKCKDVQ
ncbi:RHS repeat-associated core domain-containing protein [Variovorax paradoxus]|uniref:Putative deoxyribonuclease RhsC n=1 Tax=Variovorax paradoxus TaxID=34073 RepID=A0A0H2M9J5_VARPD|nr:RHS repeat-associated core domain-containing protein [Variovorax paradoxus]KLN57362.1 putative deoxyribonuclease RhsC [Variovorax paradoxus]